jgi:hypothetical protein
MFHSTPVTMKSVREARWVPRWELPASLFLHLLIATLLVFGLPASLSQPQDEQAINVDLVPPPKPPAQAKAQASPPAKQPRVEKPHEKSVETPKSNAAARPVLQKPVFQFGEKDAGPRKAVDGNSAQDGQAIPHPKTADTPTPKSGDAAKVETPVKLQEAKKLFSQAATGDAVATTAMRRLSRGDRATQLCLTELGEQLLNASPPYFPDQLPAYSLNGITNIEVRDAAFQSAGQWYKFDYRCEVDGDATKVVSFGLNVGDPIPRSEWQRYDIRAQ